MSFERALDFTLLWEGGGTLTNDALDRGGKTRWGISSRAHPEVDIEHLTREGAAQIYRDTYWDTLQADALPDPVALVAFDYGVNSGTRRAAACLQRAAGARVDAIIGPNTLNAVHNADARQVCETMLIDRTDFLLRLDQPRFTRGWLRRVVALAIEVGSILED